MKFHSCVINLLLNAKIYKREKKNKRGLRESNSGRESWVRRISKVVTRKGRRRVKKKEYMHNPKGRVWESTFIIF